MGTAHTTFLNNLLGNTQASKIPRTVTREVDPRLLAVWTHSDLYTYLCECADEVYDQMDHPVLGQTLVLKPIVNENNCFKEMEELV